MDVETMATERAELYFKFLLSFWAAFHRLSFSDNVKMAIVNPRVYLVYMCIECSQRTSRGAKQGVSTWHSTTIDTTWGWYGPVKNEFSDMLFRQCPFIPECLFNTRFPQGWRGGMSCFFFSLSTYLLKCWGHTQGLSIRRTLNKSEERYGYPLSNLAWAQGSGAQRRYFCLK